MANPVLAELEQQILAKGEEIRVLKAEKATKEVIDVQVAELLALKEKYQAANNGVAYGPPPVEKKKGPAQEAPKTDGPSKKELNKLKKKEKKAAYNEGKAPAGENVPSPVVAAAAPVAVPLPPPPPSAAPLVLQGPTITFHSSSPPTIARTIAALLGVDITINESPAPTPHEPYLTASATLPGASSLSGDLTIARFLCRLHGPHLLQPASAAHGAGGLAWCASEVDQWVDHTVAVITGGGGGASAASVAVLDAHLKTRTFLAGAALSLADVAVHSVVAKRGVSFPDNVQRWVTLVSSLLPVGGAQKKKGAGSAKTKSADASSTAAKGGAKAAPGEQEDTCPELEGAVEGQVCTRFPPEPSGYLHIGKSLCSVVVCLYCYCSLLIEWIDVDSY